MSYLICKKCGKHHQLEEGKSSFYFERCQCGGNLEYSATSREEPLLDQSKNLSHSHHKINWKGIFLGILFLFISLIISVMALFGADVPTTITDISFIDLILFSIITVVLTVASGFISSYVSISRKYGEGALNGGLVGVILGLMLGIAGGVVVLISAIAVFGSLSMIGGIFGSFFRKY